MYHWLILIPFGLISFIQNMAFTGSSRSRNSGDPNYHRLMAWASNGVYYITNALLTIYIVDVMKAAHSFTALIASGVVYTIATAEGSVLMMKWLLKKEAGNRMVGAGQKLAKIGIEDWEKLKAAVENLTKKTTVAVNEADKAVEAAVASPEHTLDKYVAVPAQGMKI